MTPPRDHRRPSKQGHRLSNSKPKDKLTIADIQELGGQPDDLALINDPLSESEVEGGDDDLSSSHPDAVIKTLFCLFRKELMSMEFNF